MFKLFSAVASFALAAAASALITGSAYAMALAPLPQGNDTVIRQVAYACGAGRTRVGGVCVARTTVRHARRHLRRAY